MKKSILVALLVFISLFTVVLTLPETAMATTLYVGGAGPGNYTFISTAIYDADPGDTIHVYNGTYGERLTIDRPMSLVGENRNTTTIDAGGVGSPIQVSASKVNITGFRIKGGESRSWEAGIVLDGSRDCHIHNNTISLNNGYGVALYLSTGNVIEGNNISSNGWEGVKLYESSNNIVAANSILSNGWEGVLALWSPNNTIANNIIRNNTAGVHINESPNNTVAYNNLSDNDYGIYVDISSGNRIYHNNFIDNGEHAGDNTSGNQWDDGYPSGGNYWSDYWVSDVLSGPNQDQPGGDGLGDVAYDISRGPSSDRYPLIDPQQTEPLPPSAPRNLQATVHDQRIALSWDYPIFDGNSPVVEYVIYRGTSSGAGILLTKVVGSLTYTDEDIARGLTYYYEISARNALYQGPRSNEAIAVVNQPPECAIINPSPGQYVDQLSVVDVEAFDLDGTVVTVEVKMGEEPWMQVQYNSSSGFWSQTWDTTMYPDGEITIYARAHDGTDYSEVMLVSVAILNGEFLVDPPIPWLFIVIPTIIVLMFVAILLRDRARRREEPPEEK